MKYKFGTITVNKTFKYLNPCLRLYGKEFLENLRKIYCVSSAIADVNYIKSTGRELNHHLFLLFDVSKDLDVFAEVLEYMRSHDSYESDYPVDDLVTGVLHMIVFKIPEELSNYDEFIENFKQSKYSKLYSEEEVNSIIDYHTSTYKVLTKCGLYRMIFEKEINEMCRDALESTKITLPEDAELDYKIKPEKEIFYEES